MMHRQRFESEYFPVFQQPYKLSTTVWSPLASGLLTGKYAGGKVPEGSRAAAKGYEFIGGMVATWLADGSLDKVAKLTAFAEKEMECSMAQLAIAWCLKTPNPNVSLTLTLAVTPTLSRAQIRARTLTRCLKNPNVSTVLLGATSPKQLEENLGALAVAQRLTEEHMATMEAILDNTPEGYSGYGKPFWARTVDVL